MRIFAYLCLATAVHAAPAAQYVGAKACERCHRANFTQQSKSAHANALFRAADHPLYGALPTDQSLTRKPTYSFTFFLSEGQLHSRVRDAAGLMELPMEWAFGSGRQAITFVSRVSPDYYVEHFASYYPPAQAWGPTPGQDTLQPADLPRAAGLLYKTADPETGVDGCFACHSTGPVTLGPANEVLPHETGVHCEACHGPGSIHAQHPKRNNISNPARLSATELNQFCGRCHRPPAAPGETTDWNYAWNVRHEPAYLSQSACFLKSKGALSCLTCHEPHAPAAAKPAAFYNAKCAACHARTSSACQTNCIDCHMPLVSPQANLKFTNHWIGIYTAGAKLKPTQTKH